MKRNISIEFHLTFYFWLGSWNFFCLPSLIYGLLLAIGSPLFRALSAGSRDTEWCVRPVLLLQDLFLALKIMVSQTVWHAWLSDFSWSLMSSPFRIIEMRDFKLDGRDVFWQSNGKHLVTFSRKVVYDSLALLSEEPWLFRGHFKDSFCDILTYNTFLPIKKAVRNNSRAVLATS